MVPGERLAPKEGKESGHRLWAIQILGFLLICHVEGAPLGNRPSDLLGCPLTRGWQTVPCREPPPA